jgi:serum/glucocorticoid-regulated kinase 2
VTSSDFEFLYIIGRGGFGKVWSVRSKHTKKCYALKQMSKVKIIDKKSIKSINSERDLLSELYSPYIVNMYYAFQDKEYLYLVMDLLSGGDLRYHISIHKKFSEEQTRFFICGIILSLEYIHSKGIIHRDIKPENLVLDAKGYVRLTDFGIAKKIKEDNSNESSGTPGYMSPEVLNSKNHSFPADYFALGVIGYEFKKGERPYKGKNRKEIKDKINKEQIQLTMNEQIKNNYQDIDNINSGENWSKESINFINNLLMRNPEERLGYKGINELKQHLWLKYYPWNLIKNKALPSPFIPSDSGNFDDKYCKGEDYIGEETKIRYVEILSKVNYDNCFKDFYYSIDGDNKRKNEMLLLSNKKEENNEINKSININKDNNIRKNENKKIIEKKIKNHENKKSNFILINFNINNITNNNIEGKKVNNFYLKPKNNTKTIKNEKLKNILSQLMNQNHKIIKSDLSILNSNNNHHRSFSLLNDTNLKTKNIRNKLIPYNKRLMQKYPKKDLSNIYLLKIRNTKKIESKKKIHLNINKNKKNKNDRLLSFSFKEKNNFDNYSRVIKKENAKKLNTLNESIRPNSHTRIINKIKYRIDNNSFKNDSQLVNRRRNKTLFSH